MPCLVTIAGFFLPRVVMAMLLVFTGWFGQAFQTWLWPLLGFLFMPYTTLAFMISMVYGGGVTGGYVVLVVIAVFLDFGMHSDSSKTARGKRGLSVRSDPGGSKA